MATNDALNNSLSGQTGTGQYVGDTSPTLVTPNIGVATGTSLNLGSSTNITGMIDDDTFATASANLAASSESIKAYVDSLASQVVQYTISTSTADDTTTSTGFVATSLSGSITPTSASNLILVIANANLAVETTGTSTTIRTATTQIYRSTGTPAGLQIGSFGRDLVSGSSVAARSISQMTLIGSETAPSTASHTYQLRYSNVSGQNTLTLLGSVFKALMLILELKV